MESVNHFSDQDTIILHTRAAIQRFDGSWSAKHVYLTQFSHMIARIWQATKEGDIYAEYFLYKIYDQIKALIKYFDDAEVIVKDKLLTSMKGMQIKIYTNPHPFKAQLNFKAPYSYMGAMALLKMDNVIRLILTLRKFGLPGSEEHNYFSLLTALNKTYALPRSWKSLGVTRQDIINKTALAKKAEEIMGELPEEILEEQFDFPFKPSVRGVV